jgi:multicomponent K+:H+ antiporter subunit E
MSAVRALFPAPASSIVLAVFWLVLVGALTPGQILLAVLLGVAVPMLTDRFRAVRLPVRRIDAALRLAGVFLYDLVVANVVVARAVLGRMSRIQPRFVRVPLDIDDPAGAALLAGLVTLTPGTVSVDIDPSTRTLTVHMLLVADEQAAVRQIKTRYEARIREIFQC